MTHSPLIFSIVFFASLLAFSVSLPTSPSPSPSKYGCVDILVGFLPCLTYVSTVPDNSSALPESSCCEMFSNVYDSDEDACFCYLVRKPYLFQYTLDVSKIYSLNSLCSSTKARESSLQVLCSGPLKLPPMPSLTDTNWIPSPFDRDNDDSPSCESSPAPPSLSETKSPQPKQISNNNNSPSSGRFFLGIITSLAAATFVTIFQ